MSGPTPAPTAYHNAADVAAILGCSQWWVKNQARQRRIPYCWIGGSYRFTDQHVTEIGRIFEVRPTTEAAPAARNSRHTAAIEDNEPSTVIQLTASVPRRMRATSDSAA